MTFHDHRTPRPAAVPPAARGLPGPMRRAELREALESRIERYLTILDHLDGDPDLEAGGDLEPSLCGAGTHQGGALRGLQPSHGGDDREEENEHGGDVQDEPHDREEDCDPDAIIAHGTPRRRHAPGMRKRELIAEARTAACAVLASRAARGVA